MGIQVFRWSCGTYAVVTQDSCVGGSAAEAEQILRDLGVDDSEILEVFAELQPSTRIVAEICRASLEAASSLVKAC
jgi:hypothetical protein